MYCRYCGKEIADGSSFCPYCDKSLAEMDIEEDGTRQLHVKRIPNASPGLITTAQVFFKVFMILLAVCTLGIALSWALPIKRRLFPRLDNREEVSMGLKICTLIFVCPVTGILLLAGYHD